MFQHEVSPNQFTLSEATMTNASLTQEELKSQLHYDPETGVFTSLKNRARNKIKIGQELGYLDQDGYVFFCLLKKTYRAHRLAWLYMTGEMPANLIDHIDGIRHNNCWRNLRPATQSENQQNIKLANKTSKTGLLGASFHKHSKKYVSYIRVNGKRMFLGYHEDAKSAHAAYLEAKRKLHTHCTI